MNWRGRALTSHEVIVGATSRTGLRVHAELDQTTYPAGIKIPDQNIKALQTTGTCTDTPSTANGTPARPSRHARPS